jgi:2-keto-4-pentenoate hydratase/2-oxohepta-3-ene-1,7-dioic acid hydratase in catechol pathway
MKIARSMINALPAWIASEDGLCFFPLLGNPFEGYTLDRSKALKEPKLLAPIAPPQIFAIGLNYREHAKEFNNPIPEYPVVFIKSISSVTGPGSAIIIPESAGATFVDYEVELAVVLRREVKNISPHEALEAVLGYTIANDVTSRDWQKGSKGGGQWCRAKSFDTFCPLGPWIITPDEIPDPNALSLQSRVNGELRQDSHTKDMIFPVAELISFLSRGLTLLPGAVILTGTPSGVGAGMNPPVRLAAGDRVDLSIEGIGQLSNPVALEG